MFCGTCWASLLIFALVDTIIRNIGIRGVSNFQGDIDVKNNVGLGATMNNLNFDLTLWQFRLDNDRHSVNGERKILMKI